MEPFAVRKARDFSRAPPTLPYVNWATWRVALAGALVAALTTVPGLGGGTLWDNSETAYGEVAREILISHDWIVMHLNGQPWFVQPPLYFWIAALFARAFGVSEFALRLPSALATIAMAAAVGYVVARLASMRAGLLSAVILSTSLMQAVLGRLAIMDALLDLAVAVAILAWFGALQTGERRWWYVGWASLALGTLAKGPVAPAMALLVIVPWALWNRAARGAFVMPSVWRFLAGFGLFALIVVPWAVALYRAAGGAAFAEMLGHYTVGRYLGTIENQSGPPYYYVPVIILGFFPWFAYLVPASVEAWRDAAGDRSGSLSRLALVWAIVPFVFFTFAKTKLPNYIALELPALAILVALWFDRVVERDDRRAALAWSGVVPLMIIGLGFAVTAFSHDNRLSGDLAQLRVGLLSLALAILLGAFACFGLLLVRRTAWLGPFALGIANVAVMLIIALAATPLVERFKPIPQLAAIIDRQVRPGDIVALQGVSGGNALAFYTQPGIVQLVGPNQIPPAPENDPKLRLCAAPRAFVVTSKRRPKHDPTYGRTRHVLAAIDNDVLFLIDGPPCDVK
jgi:4-amino-4-deoxy-L-arabinose transferase-like glycosyltransferase